MSNSPSAAADSVTSTGISSEARYTDLFERLMDPGFLLHAETYEVRDVNSAAERVFGGEREALLGRVFLSWVDEEQRSSLEQSFRIARRRYYPRQVRAWMRPTDRGRLLAEASICTLGLASGEEVVQVILKDVTREWEAEQAIARYTRELEEANRKLEELSITDEMTKAFNYRHFKKVIALEHERSSRYGSTYSVIFCDIDNFKHYNDRNGHPAGDELLKHFARLLKECIRDVDVVARYGGEEFVVLCPETNHRGALELAERLRERVSSTAFLHAEHQPLKCLSMSSGVSTFPDHGKSADEVLKCADMGVYRSKKAGRNRVTSFELFKRHPEWLEEAKKESGK